jgi:hypothetical protein
MTDIMIRCNECGASFKSSIDHTCVCEEIAAAKEPVRSMIFEIEIDPHGGKATVVMPRPVEGVEAVIKRVGDGEVIIEAPRAYLPKRR